MITFLAVSGFLGAGKTTTLIATAKHLEAQGRRVAIITNDQAADLVDTQLVRSSAAQGAEVTGGCFCCRFDDLLTVARELVDKHGVDTLLAEAVGSCTDLQATVIRPLRAYYGDTFAAGRLVTVVEPHRLSALRTSLVLDDADSDLSYLFGKQLQEADVIAVNKLDLLTDGAATSILDQVQASHPSATVVGYSATTGRGIDTLVEQWLGAHASQDRVIDIDYDRYANAEAALAWLNQSLVVSSAGGFDPAAWARTMLGHLSASAAENGWLIGHAKVGVQTAEGLTKSSVTEAGAEPTIDAAATTSATLANVTINARVACAPEQLDSAVDAAVEQALAATGTVLSESSTSPAFKPGYPRPTHRLTASAS